MKQIKTKHQLQKRIKEICDWEKKLERSKNIKFHLFKGRSIIQFKRQLYCRNPRFYAKDKVRRWAFHAQ